jgi:hypothetical protein
MKKTIAIVLSLLGVSLIATQTVSAADLTEAQTTKIVENCSVAQSTLQRISSSDTTTRINRGREYDKVLKLFYTFNTRAASNNITEPRLTELTKQFEETLNSFRADYNRYNDQLKGAYEGNCRSQASAFYDNLTRTRDNRSQVNADIVRLDNLINDYQSVVEGLVQ